mgnify:CR=1 FL=1
MIRLRTNAQPLITPDGKCVECWDNCAVVLEDHAFDACWLCTQLSEIEYREYKAWAAKHGKS